MSEASVYIRLKKVLSLSLLRFYLRLPTARELQNIQHNKLPSLALLYSAGSDSDVILPRTILSLLGDSGGLGRASFFFLVATPVTLRFFRVSVPQIITARFLVNLESPWVRCSWCHFSSSTQIPPPRCTCEDNREESNGAFFLYTVL